MPRPNATWHKRTNGLPRRVQNWATSWRPATPIRRLSNSRMANDDPNFRLAQRDLAFAYGNLGDVKLRLNNPAAARDAYDGMLKILSRLAKVESKRAQIDLADCYGRLGHLEEATEDFPAAVHLFEHGLAILEQLNNEGTTIADLPDNRASLLLQTQAAAVCTAAPQAIASLEFGWQPKEILPELLGIRSRALARRGKAQEAAASADKLASLELADGRDFLHAAVGFALCRGRATSQARREAFAAGRALCDTGRRTAETSSG